MTVPLLTYHDRNGVRVDFGALIQTRLLIQANSGGGKSQAIRQLLEATHGRVQQLVLDREGEFSTLREKFDFLLVGPGGEVAADLRTAPTLARKLLELGVSAVIDLSEMALPAQRQYVAAFVNAISEAPRALWHDALVVIDEAHLFAPQKFKKGEKFAAESLAAIALAASIWRKRGYCLALATQRIAKLDNDVAAELLNKLIGRTSEEDRKRAADELGMNGEESRGLKNLAPGHFWAYGPAITNEPVLVRTEKDLKTHPPKRGAARESAPPTPAAIRAIADALAELPKEAAEEAHTLEGLKRRTGELERKLKQAEKNAPVVPPRVVEKPVVDQKAIERAVTAATSELRKALEAAMKFIVNISTANFDVAGVNKAELESAISTAVEKATKVIDQRLDGRARELERLKEQAAGILTRLKAALKDDAPIEVAVGVTKNAPVSVAVTPARRPAPPPRRTVEAGDGSGLTAPQQRILNALGSFEGLGIESAAKGNVAVFADQSPSSSGFANNLGRLRALGYIDYPSGGFVALTDAGRALVEVNPVASVDELHRAWESKLPRPKWAILAALIEAHPTEVERTELAERSGQSATSSGYANNLGNLRSLGLIGYKGGGLVHATDLLFPAGLS